MITLVLIGLLGVLLYGRAEGWSVSKTPPAVWGNALSEYMRVFRPEGTGPFPTLVLFHGCEGSGGNQVQWAQMAAEAGYAAVVVDSFAPRGLTPEEGKNWVCSGLRLSGRQWAGDVLAALEQVRVLPFVNEDALILMGWSHGAWAVMDLFTMDLSESWPSTLTAPPDRGLDGVRGAVLFYPLCGDLTLSRRQGWAHRVPTLIHLGDADTVADTRACQATAQRLVRRGMPVEVASYPKLGHHFDRPVATATPSQHVQSQATRRASLLSFSFISRILMTLDTMDDTLTLEARLTLPSR